MPTTGTIEVGVASGLVRKITWRARTVSRPEDGTAPLQWYTDVLEFSDYGIRVEVDRPM